jgi:hypothetical protein
MRRPMTANTETLAAVVKMMMIIRNTRRVGNPDFSGINCKITSVS